MFLSVQAQLPLLQAHLLNLNSLLEQHESINELRETCAPLRLCIIITLVKQAEVYDGMYQCSLPSAPERMQYHSGCRESLSEAATVTTELSPDDYYYLDPYLGVGVSVPYRFSGFIYLGLATRFVVVVQSVYCLRNLPTGSNPVWTLTQPWLSQRGKPHHSRQKL